MTVLTIGILSLPNRQFTVLPRLMAVLEPQLANKPVQLIVLTDNKSMTTGAKRQRILDMAVGKYIAYIDDDDLVSGDYVSSILEAAKSDADCLVFNCLVKDKFYEKLCQFSKNFTHGITATGYLRNPNHLCPIKTEIARKIPWPNLTIGEDTLWATAVRPLLLTEAKIPKILYFYQADDVVNLKQNQSTATNKRIDVVILSYAKTPQLEKVTKNCLASLFRSELRAEELFNVIVLESQPGVIYDFPSTVTLTPPLPYGYNKFANFGRKRGTAEFVCICNNDLIFYENWARNMLHVADTFSNILSFSPFCPKTHRTQFEPDGNIHFGYEIASHITGWCLFHRRSLYDIIGDLDERFIHWYADNDFAETLKHHKLNHALVTRATVEHVNGFDASVTARTVLNSDELYLLTHGQKQVFKDKWKL